MSCNGCSSSHQELMNTWTNKGDLQANDYNPFDSNLLSFKENFGCCDNYSVSKDSWTRGANVTPDNTPGINNYVIKATPVNKETFCIDCPSTYSTLDQTWKNQKPYSS